MTTLYILTTGFLVLAGMLIGAYIERNKQSIRVLSGTKFSRRRFR